MRWRTGSTNSATLRGETVQERSAYAQENAALYGVDLSNLAR